MTIKKCCMNCSYYFADPLDNSRCTIDNEKIEPEISEIVKCKAYSEWIYAME